MAEPTKTFKLNYWVFDPAGDEQEIERLIPLACTVVGFDAYIETLEANGTVDIMEELYGVHDASGGATKFGWEVGYILSEINEKDIDKCTLKWEALLSQGKLT